MATDFKITPSVNGTAVSLTSHTHTPSSNAPADVQPGQAAAAGSGSSPSCDDHAHRLSFATLVKWMDG